jgi:hypothetical protein
MALWWWRLRVSDTNLRPLILAIALAKFGIWFWSLSQITQIILADATLPLWSLPARAIIMFAACMQVWVTTRIKLASKVESSLGSF